MVYVIQVCCQLSANLCDITLLCVQLKPVDDVTEELSETCRIFYFKNKFEKLVHLVGFIIRIYHDVRSPEHQTFPFSGCKSCAVQTNICAYQNLRHHRPERDSPKFLWH